MLLVDRRNSSQALIAQESRNSAEKLDIDMDMMPDRDTKALPCLACLEGLAESNLFYAKANFHYKTCSYQPRASFIPLSLHKSAHFALYQHQCRLSESIDWTNCKGWGARCVYGEQLPTALALEGLKMVVALSLDKGGRTSISLHLGRRSSHRN